MLIGMRAQLVVQPHGQVRDGVFAVAAPPDQCGGAVQAMHAAPILVVDYQLLARFLNEQPLSSRVGICHVPLPCCLVISLRTLIPE